MTLLKTLGGVLVAALIMTYGAELGEQLDIPGAEQIVPTVEAIVGRPLTPVSAAGVARRTVRRCRAGAYRCSLPGSMGDISQRPIVAMNIHDIERSWLR